MPVTQHRNQILFLEALTVYNRPFPLPRMFSSTTSKLLAYGICLRFKSPTGGAAYGLTLRAGRRRNLSSHETALASAAELLRSAGGECNSARFGTLGKPPAGKTWPAFLKKYPETFSVEIASDDRSHNFTIKLKSHKAKKRKKSTLNAAVELLSGQKPVELGFVGRELKAYKPPGAWISFFKAHNEVFHLQQYETSGWHVSLGSASSSKLSQVGKHPQVVSPIPSIFALPDGSEYQLIDNEDTLDLVLRNDACLDPGRGSPRQFVAFDCEGVPENIHLLQLSTNAGTYVLDCKSIGPKTVCQKLRNLFTSIDVIKVLHDLDCDAQAIYEISGVQLNGVLDTQLVSTHLWDIPYKPGLNDFLRRMDLPTHPSKDLLKQWQGDVKPWTVRPLDRQYQDYAALDVVLLQKSITPMLEKVTEHDLNTLFALSSEKAAQNIKADKSIFVDHQTALESLHINEYTLHTITEPIDLIARCNEIYNSATSIVVVRIQKKQEKTMGVDIIYDTTHLKINCAEISAEDMPAIVEWKDWQASKIVTVVSNLREIQDGLESYGYKSQNFVDVGILGELLFGTPFLSQESFESKLFFRHLGVSSVSKDTETIYAALIEKELKHLAKDGFSLSTLMKASVVSNGNSQQTCFDPSAAYKLQSLNLFRNHPKNKDGLCNAFLGKPLLELNDFESMMDVLPERLRSKLPASGTGSITEIVLDIGRRPIFWKEDQRVFLDEEPNFLVLKSDVDTIVTDHLGNFGSDNRAGLEGQLHRFSAIRDRERRILGLTIRVGRHVSGNADLILDLIKGTKKSILILGSPGSGKTTIVREIARLLAEDENVMVVDTSNEIGGDGTIQHACLGQARRMMVDSLDRQSNVMIECVQNHTPHTMIIDEIGRQQEVNAARTVKQRGVRIVASAHGDLRSLVGSPDLVSLVGGLKQVTVGDDMANMLSKRKNASPGFSKLKTERAAAPPFDVFIEIGREDRHKWRIITNTTRAVDCILAGEQYDAQLRVRDPETGKMTMEHIKA